MDIFTYVQRSRRTLDDILEVVQKKEREHADVLQRNRFLEQANTELNTDINRYRLQAVELKAEVERLNRVIANGPLAATQLAEELVDAGFHI